MRESMRLNFDNRLLRDLPADRGLMNRPREVTGAVYSRVASTPVSNPRLVAHSPDMLSDLGLAPHAVEQDSFAAVFAGNELLPGMESYATCYGGHQFGSWAGQLGDGRAMGLGEVVTGDGLRWELQLKGAGPTPYSRSADGRAVMRSSVREFLCSEAMHHLGVPTTRALTLVSTGDSVVRDMFYDGHPQREPGAIVCRAARSFLRFGHFEIFASRSDVSTLEALARHVTRLHFGLDEDGMSLGDAVVRMFDRVMRSTAVMVAHWMRVGFVHGVMNTDNMSILGLTVDYGPYGWLESYDPNWTPNTTDNATRRYRYGHQPGIALWNLTCLAHALTPLVGDTALLQERLKEFEREFMAQHQGMMARKLGLSAFSAQDSELTKELFGLLSQTETDMPIFFRALMRVSDDQVSAQELTSTVFEGAYYRPDELTDGYHERFDGWLARYRQRIRSDALSSAEREDTMRMANPKYVLRNYMAHEVIQDAEKGDGTSVMELLQVLRRPYDDQPGAERWEKRRPEWARDTPGCSQLSCSS